MKYRLMPYVYAQARHSADHGLPMVRALFVEYPDDPGSWLVDDQYLFGQDILVAPLFEEVTGRDVYLPPGNWIDYQTGAVYAGGWHHIEAGTLPVVMLVRDGAVLPHIALAQSTKDLDWSSLDLVVFSTDGQPADGYVALPPEAELHELSLTSEGGVYQLANDPLGGQVTWTVTPYATYEGR
jgi:alpha-D-xyloside xylohydrolase